MSESGTLISGGSSQQQKLNFDDVTVQHKCILRDRQKSINRIGDGRLITFLVSMIVVSETHPKTKKYFHSTDAVYKEIIRHMFSNYFYIIHPFSKFRFYWSSFMMFVSFLWFLHVSFMYSFHIDLGTSTAWITIGTSLDILCILDLFMNFYTGYKKKHSNFIVLHHGSITRNYLQCGTFFVDFVSTLPLGLIRRLYFAKNREALHGFDASIVFYHLVYLVKFLRFFTMYKMTRRFWDLMHSMKMSYVNTLSILMLARVIMFLHFCICGFKFLVSIIFTKSVSRQRIGESASINFLLDKNNSVTSKYGMVLQIISWTIFNTSFQIQTHDLVEGKAIFATLIIIGVTFNVYLLIKVLSLMNIMNKPRMKYLEIFNQLDAYMRKRQFPIQLQNRLKFFFKKKFRRFYYEEDVIKKMLSEPLWREILINTDKLFVERVKLFQGVPKKLVSKIVASFKKELFLHHDLIVKAGSTGDCMFFIASGTVCVTTNNGKELCHLEDGDYFGECALILKNNKRIANVTAIEFVEVFVLDYSSFKKYVQTNGTIMQKLSDVAELRMKLTLKKEEELKRQLKEEDRESYADPKALANSI